MAGPPSFAQGAVIERLASHHDRSSFVCSDPTFAEWLQRNARQFHERGNARVWIWTDSSDTSRVLGYFDDLAYRDLEGGSAPACRRERQGAHANSVAAHRQTGEAPGSA